MPDRYEERAREIVAATPWREMSPDEDAVAISGMSLAQLRDRIAKALRDVERETVERCAQKLEDKCYFTLSDDVREVANLSSRWKATD